MNCPYCNSTNFKKQGKLKSGAKRFMCKDCGRFYSEHTIVKELVNYHCPICDEPLKRSGFTNERTVRRYICKKCNRRFSENTLNGYDSYLGDICPQCGHKTIKEKKIDGYSVLYCKCGWEKTDHPSYKILNSQDKKTILLYCVHLNQNIEEMARQLKKSPKLVKNWVDYCKQEKINLVVSEKAFKSGGTLCVR